MSPTPYPELNDVLGQLVEGMKAVLREQLVGAYLQGSFATGGFDRHSDVDFVVALQDELSDEDLRALQDMHGRVYELECPWAQHLEGSYFPRDVLLRHELSGSPLWYLDHGARTLEFSSHCNTVVVRWVLREKGVILVGPDPAELVNPVPTGVLRADIWATMRDWGNEILSEPERFRNRFYQTFIVLSYCRMLHDLHVGRAESKRTGAEWAREVLDASWRDLIDRTWEGRPDPARSVREPADAGDFARTLEFVRYTMGLGAECARNLGVAGAKGTSDRA